MRFQSKELRGGMFIRGLDDHWYWSKDGGTYSKDINFFSVHWEIQYKSSNVVRCHVESPRHEDDPVLNNTKSQLVSAIVRCADIEQTIISKGFGYAVGRRISESEIQRNKSTEPFKVILQENRVDPVPQKNIENIHAILSIIIDRIVERYRIELNSYFR